MPGVANEVQAAKDRESGNEGGFVKDGAEVKDGEVVRERAKVIEGKICDGILEGDGGGSGASGDAQKLETGKAYKEPEEVKLTKAAKKRTPGRPEI